MTETVVKNYSSDTVKVSIEKKVEIINKYDLTDHDLQWSDIPDNRNSVEVIKLQKGSLPEEGDDDMQIIMDFLDNQDLLMRLLKENNNFGSLYLSARRYLRRMLEQ